ncbi:hypothetical protein BH10BAC5_BH10BAC5_25280 [soil metagenome]
MFFTSRNRKLDFNVKKLEELDQNIRTLNQENTELLKIIESREKVLSIIVSEKSKGFPWLADAIAEFYKYQDFEIAKYLEKKKHPAVKKADAVREISRDNKILRKQIKIAQNYVKYYENLFPWINEYIGDDLDDLLESVNINNKLESEEESDPVLKFIQRGEYERLSTTERNQKALDRYLSSRKKAYEIGRDYERYIGYLYESQGFKVEYIGIEKGFEDLGRDLICIKGNEIEIIQCKCWASYKTIHEKHINQLYGTAVKYYIDHKQDIERKKSSSLFTDLIGSGMIKATFVTSTKLSNTANSFADALGIKVVQEKQLGKYPVIKCNISIAGEKIYHLPFDQQYDKTLIKNSGEFYASTVQEAENRGFRRAFRWRGSN